MVVRAGRLVLIWGMTPDNSKINTIYEKIFKMTLKKKIKILIIDFGNSGNKTIETVKKYEERFNIYKDYHISIKQLDYDYAKSDISYLNRRFKETDVIWLWWGNPITLKKRLIETNCYNKIINNMKINKKIVVGNSAWGVIFFKKYIKSIDNKLAINGNNQYTHKVYSGFWLFKELWTAHFTERKRQEHLETFSKQYKITWIGIDEKAAIIINFQPKNKSIENISANKKWSIWIYNPEIKILRKLKREQKDFIT